MQYLIDGHNLIACMPDIDLSDPDDEAKLVQKLRRWTAASAKRHVTVIFDAGLPAGESTRLSSGPVKAIFAPNNKTADDLIIQRINNVTNIQGHVVVTSDQAVMRVAQGRRITVIRSQSFAEEMENEIAQRRSGKGRRSVAEPGMSPAELDEWLTLFGGEPPPKPKAQAPKGKKKIRPAAPPPAAEDDEELQEWLRLFGYEE